MSTARPRTKHKMTPRCRRSMHMLSLITKQDSAPLYAIPMNSRYTKTCVIVFPLAVSLLCSIFLRNRKHQTKMWCAYQLSWTYIRLFLRKNILLVC